jgi:hypothetical protein
MGFLQAFIKVAAGSESELASRLVFDVGFFSLEMGMQVVRHGG